MSGKVDVDAMVQGDVAHLNNLNSDHHESVASVAQHEINDARHSLDPSHYADYIRAMQGQLTGYSLTEVNFYNFQSADPIARPQHGGDEHDLYPKIDDATRKSWKSPDHTSEIKTFDDGSSRGLHYDSSGKVDAINETDPNGYSQKLRMVDGAWVKGPVSEQWGDAVDPLTLVKPKDSVDPTQPDATGAATRPDSTGAATRPDATGAATPPDATGGTDPRKPDATGVVSIAAPDENYENSEVGNLVLNPDQKFQGASDTDSDRYQRVVKGTTEVVNPDNLNDIKTYNANGFTLSKHDDGKWYVHNDNGGKFVEVDGDSIKQDENGTVKYTQAGLLGGTHTLGVTDSSLFTLN